MTSQNVNRRPVGIGVIGTGFGRHTQVPAFAATEHCRVVALASHTPGKAARVAAELEIPHAFDAPELDRMLALDELDLVCVTSPPDTHLDYSRRALAAGKHVLCEKPTALDAAEAQAMVEAARGSDRMALLDHELRFDPARRLYRDLVMEGFLGRLLHVKIEVESPLRLDPERPWGWWSDAERGGGFLGALGSHVVDAVRYTFGEVVAGRAMLHVGHEERSDPESGTPRRVTADDYASIWLRLEEGAVVSAVLSSISRPRRPGWRMSAHGTAASLVLEPDGTLSSQSHGEREWTDRTPPPIPFDAEALGMNDNMWSRAFTIFAAEIVSSLFLGRTAVPLAATFEDGLRSQQVLDALRASNEREAWVACGPDAPVGAGS